MVGCKTGQITAYLGRLELRDGMKANLLIDSSSSWDTDNENSLQFLLSRFVAANLAIKG
jgi:hypothetical protein